jgi:hypothetical protein
MLVGKFSYFTPNILENDDVMISYKLQILDVVKSAGISVQDHISFVLVFWYYHSEKSFKCAVSIEIWVRSVFPGFDPGYRKIQVPVPSRSPCCLVLSTVRSNRELCLSLDNDFPSVLEEYLWHISCDNLTFDRNFRRTCKLLFLTKNCLLTFW